MELVIGIAGLGVYTPPGVHTAEWIGAQSGIPADVIVSKFGLRQKCRAGPEEHVAEMGRKAALSALADAGLDPDEVDLVLYHGSQYKDSNPWSAACRIQDRIGARRAAAFEVNALCAGAPVALKAAGALMAAERSYRTVLLVAATREADLIDYRNPRSRFLYNMADGGAAAVLRRGLDRHRFLAAALRSDGSFSHDVLVPPGGRYLDVPDPEGMKARLDPVSLPNFLGVVDEALALAGLDRSAVRFLAATHMKRSIHQALLDALGLTWEQTYYLEDYGHLQSADQYIALQEGARRGLLKSGDIAVLAAAGTGYTWSAAVVRWG